MDYLGQFAIVHLILHVVCICVAYWALNSIKLDQFLKGLPITSSSLYDFYFYFTGTAVSNFIVDLLQYSTQVKYLIK